MATVYLETTIIGYLSSRPSRDLVTAANQKLTHDWWDHHGGKYELYISEAVVAESRAGDPQAAKERLELISLFPVLGVSEKSRDLAEKLLRNVPLPENAEVDAMHIAIAAVNGMDYLLTWNCSHIANASLLHRIEAVCRSAGYEPPTICTPQQLMEG